MRHSLHSHIIYLEHRIQSLKDSLTKAHVTDEDLEELERQIAMSELALEHYRKAYALELSVSNPDAPDSSDSKNGGSGGGEDSSSDNKQGGSSKIAAQARKRARVRWLPFAACGRHTSLPAR